MAAARNSRSPGRRSRQRGVVAIFAAIALVALLAAVGIAIDLSRFYFEQRNLQRMASVAALDAARVAGGCLGVPANPDETALGEVNQSVLRNGGKSSDVSDGSVAVGRMLRDANGVRSFSPGTSDQDRAVQVILRRAAPARLIPVPGTGGAEPLMMSATAAAQSRPIVNLSVGTTVANIDDGLLGNTLGSLLGGPANIGLVSYQGLIAQTVALGDLADAAGLPVEEFLDTPTGLRQLLSNLLNAVAGTAPPAVSATLATLRDATDPALTVLPSDVVRVVNGYEDALDSLNLSVGTLLTQAAQAAVSNSSINVPVNLALPLLGDINLDVNLISPGNIAAIPAGLSPDTGFPDAVAANAQGLVQLNAELLPILGNPVSLKLFVKAAEATAELTDIRCARRGQPQHDIDVTARPHLARIGIGEFDDISQPNPAIVPTQVLNVLGIKVFAYADIVVGQDCAVPVSFQGPPFPTDVAHVQCPVGQGLAGAIAALPSSISITTEPAVFGALIHLVLDPVLALLTPALSAAVASLADPVLTPVLQMLGLSLGTADVSIIDVTNDQPYLFIDGR